MLRRTFGTWLACSLGLFTAPAAVGAVPHTIVAGESMWSISSANGVTMQSLASHNGLSVDSLLLPGMTLQVPTVADGAVSTTSTTGTVAPAPGMGHVPSPYGDLHLAPGAAEAWNAMRAESLSTYGVDLYPGGPVSAYRTYAQQAELYEAYLSGYGAPANPPGSSSHEYGTAVDLAASVMRPVIDEIGWKYGWTKVHAPDEWWHVDYVGG
jgi:LAS superfamily LD-carboxypeptidase LdcB